MDRSSSRSEELARTMPRWQRLAVLLIALGLLAAGCGRDGAPTTEPTAEPTAEPGTTATGTPADDGTPADTGGEVATDFGVTEEPCPQAVNPDNGCIYLGILSDLTEGPFAALAVPITDAQIAFWRTVNEDGGIGGYDIDVETYIRDNKYNPEVHNEEYQAIKGDILALAQTLGSPQTAAILPDLEASDVVGAPASWTSLWAFEDVIIESGTNYCFESMNSVDYAVENLDVQSVMAVHYPGDYGGDAAEGVRIAAEAHGLDFTDHETPPGADNQAGAIDAIVQGQPDLVIITTGPREMATIVGQAAAQGFTGRFIGTSPTWNPGLLESPAAPAIEALYMQSGPWGPWGTDTPGHNRLRETLGDVTPNDGYVAGWVWQYPLRAAIEAAAANGDLTRAGLRAALQELEDVDYEGMLPNQTFVGDPGDTVFRQSLINEIDTEAPTGVTVVQDFFVGPTAEGHDFSAPCFQG